MEIERLLNGMLSGGRRLFGSIANLFAKQGPIGKIALLIVSIVFVCCICSVPLALFSSPTEEPNRTAADQENVIVDVEEQRRATPAVDTIGEDPPLDPTQTLRFIETPRSTVPPTSTPTVALPSLPAALSDVLAGREWQEALVTEIVDGDTIGVEIDGQRHRLRYIGIDTPERGDPLGAEATAANSDLVDGEIVFLTQDQSETDRFGRLLRYVYLADGTMVNEELVLQGFAEAVAYPPDTHHQARLDEAQQSAVDNRLGLWAADVVQAPTEGPVPTDPPTQPPPPTVVPTPLPAPTQPPATAAPPPTAVLPPTAEPSPGQVIIGTIYYDGQVSQVESDEYVEVRNIGGSAVNLAGWRINADDPGQDFFFQELILEPGSSCRVYTNEVHGDSCEGRSFGSGRAIWNNSDKECGHLYDSGGVEVSTFCY